MKVHIICYEDLEDWILGKFATRLCDEVIAQGIACDVSSSSDPTADINHHVNYSGYNGRKTTIDSIILTHINTYQKLERVRMQVVEAEMGICMSSQTMEMLAQRGIPRSKLCFIKPAHDGCLHHRKTIIGITTRVYSDGRKRETMLLELAKKISSDDFAFRIMGNGWAPIIAQLQTHDFEIEYYERFDLDRYNSLVPTFDYYLYFGMDEGSMGFIDACAAGVPTIVTPQGFHLDAPNAITHAFTDLPELERIFHHIAAKKKTRQRSVADWTWSNYARNHLIVWEYLLARRAGRRSAEPVHLQLAKLGVVATQQPSYKSFVNYMRRAILTSIPCLPTFIRRATPQVVKDFIKTRILRWGPRV
jgi:hypothetical protein